MGASIQYNGQLLRKDYNSDSAVKAALRDTQKYGIALLRSRSPVDTGRLRAGWKSEVGNRGILWKNDVPYTVYNIMGTVNMPVNMDFNGTIEDINGYFRKRLAYHIGKKYDAKEGNTYRSADARNESRQRRFNARADRASTDSQTPTYDALTKGW